MSKTQKLIELTVYNDCIQEYEVRYESGTPYYDVTETLNKMYNVMNFKGCCEKFDNYIQEECLKYINQSIEMSKEEIPVKYKNDEKGSKW